MKGSMRVIEPGSATDRVVEYADPPALDVLQATVGGYIEHLGGWRTFEGAPCAAFCNEDGKRLRLIYNGRATQLWVEALKSLGVNFAGDFLVGPVVILTGDREFMAAL